MATLVGKPEPSVSPITTNVTTLSSSSSSLKRKRPPSLDIPNVLREIRTTLVSSPRNGVVESAAGVAVFSRKGKKKFMEDAHKIVSFSPSNPGRRFFGVYDGHGGKMAAEFAAENLHNNVVEMMKNCTGIDEAVRAGYLKTDQDFLNQGLCSGTCCVTAVIEGPRIAVSNVGDCRAVLCRGGVAEPLTKDHRAEDEDERKRIEDKGGYVEIHRGAWRVHGVLTVSRSIGDAHLKDWVLAEPETKVLKLTPDMEFLVLASDGLWEQVGNQEAVDAVKRFCSAQNKQGPASGHCLKENNYNDYCHVNVSPSSKLRRISLVKKKPKGVASHSPVYTQKTTSCFGESEKDENVSSENGSPPSKLRRISLVKRVNMKIEESPTKENIGCDYNNKSPSSGGLVTACKELANLAVTRGGLDDITVMVIDLSHFTKNHIVALQEKRIDEAIPIGSSL